MEGVEVKYASWCYMTGVLYTQFILFSNLFYRIFHLTEEESEAEKFRPCNWNRGKN